MVVVKICPDSFATKNADAVNLDFFLHWVATCVFETIYRDRFDPFILEVLFVVNLVVREGPPFPSLGDVVSGRAAATIFKKIKDENPLAGPTPALESPSSENSIKPFITHALHKDPW
ncbi:hypothetical protein NPIL_395591 [Nephila pilipes]|uniref:Uncharacterized protein n=1 Tax=Nephila pilipes TaxID=299642 RepID=A0A8X6ITB6_NEPPI|nr:hypothetical protein NPIL_395591 [Nephila pilipes]